jgi:GntR family transcriptional regulator
MSTTRAAAANRETAVPLYHQVYLVLLENIQRGEYEAGAKIPTETEMCKMFDVSRLTIRRALDELEKDKWITRRAGVGSFVNKIVPIPQAPRTMEDLFQLTDSLRTLFDARLASFAYVVPPPLVKKTMELGSEEKVLETIRVRSYKGTPFFYVRMFTREELGKQFTREELEKESLVWLLRKKIKFDSADQSVSAILSGPDAIDHLGVPIGSALLQITWIIRDEGGAVIEYVVGVARPDMYQIRNCLKLGRSAPHRSRSSKVRPASK